MVPYGTTTATPAWVRITSSTQPPTGGWDSYDRVAHAYYSMGPSKIEPLDPRKNPKNWAIWFREFLALILPVREMVAALPDPAPAHRFAHHSRSGPPHTREWKMKNWIQALRTN